MEVTVSEIMAEKAAVVDRGGEGLPAGECRGKWGVTVKVTGSGRWSPAAEKRPIIPRLTRKGMLKVTDSEGVTEKTPYDLPREPLSVTEWYERNLVGDGQSGRIT